jgi:hypothetical protein
MIRSAESPANSCGRIGQTIATTTYSNMQRPRSRRMYGTHCTNRIPLQTLAGLFAVSGCTLSMRRRRLTL